MSSPQRQPPPVPARTLSMADKKKSVDGALAAGMPVSVPLSRSPRLLRKMTSTAGGKFSETVDEDASCTTVAIGKDTYTIGEILAVAAWCSGQRIMHLELKIVGFNPARV
jgi:hypothetical protein